MARRNQVVVLTPFTLAGAMAPVTLAGALAQQHAEALAGLVDDAAVRPGAPFVYGGFTSNVDMKSGAPAFGTPEYMKTAIVGGQLARRSRPALPLLERQRRQFARRAGGLRERVLALGRDHGRRQLADARRGLDGGRPAGVVREDGARRRSARHGRRVPAPAAGRGRGTGARGDARGRARRAFLRRRAHPVALPHRLFRADDFRLAQLRDLARGRLADRRRRGRAHRRRTARAIMRRRRSSPSGARRSKPSSPAARPRAARRPTFETERPQVRRAIPRRCMRRSQGFFSRSESASAFGAAPRAAILARAGVDPAAFGAILTAYTAAYLLAMSAAGALAHRFGVRKVLARHRHRVRSRPLRAPERRDSAGGRRDCDRRPGFFGGVVDVTMNAEGARIERRLGRPILARLHGAASAGMAIGAILGSLIVASSAPWAAGLIAAIGSPRRASPMAAPPGTSRSRRRSRCRRPRAASPSRRL